MLTFDFFSYVKIRPPSIYGPTLPQKTRFEVVDALPKVLAFLGN